MAQSADTKYTKTEGRVFVVSAPSGTGKTTLNRRLVTEHADKIQMSVSFTARPMRPGETEGVHYHHTTADDFKARIAKGEMLEYAEVFGNFYGTSLAELERIRHLGRTPLLEIDVQGWSQAKAKLTNAVSIFILPPSIESLWKRLEKRGTETLEVRWRRLNSARKEIENGHIYEWFIVNKAVDDAYVELQDIIINGKKGRVGNAKGKALCAELLKEFDQAPWLKKLSAEIAEKKK